MNWKALNKTIGLSAATLITIGAGVSLPCRIAHAQMSLIAKSATFAGGEISSLLFFETADEMYMAISKAVIIASSGAAACNSADCTKQIEEIINRHPYIGKFIENYEISRYLNKYPDKSQAIKVISTQTNIPSTQDERTFDKYGNAIAVTIPPPPGDCSPNEHRNMQNDVDELCKGTELRRCLKSDSPSIINQKIEAYRKCSDARHTINTKCFRGGDHGHREAAYGLYIGLSNCQDLIK